MKSLIIFILIGLVSFSSIGGILSNNFEVRILKSNKTNIIQYKYVKLINARVAINETTLFGGIQLPIQISSLNMEGIKIKPLLKGIYYDYKFIVSKQISNYEINIIPDVSTELSPDLLTGDWVNVFAVNFDDEYSTIKILDRLTEQSDVVPYIGFVSSEGVEEFIPKIVQGEVVLDKFQGIIISPNPSKGIFTIDASDYVSRKNSSFEMDIDVKDIYGKNILKQKSKLALQEIDLSNYASGVYIITVTQEGEILHNQKLIKQ